MAVYQCCMDYVRFIQNQQYVGLALAITSPGCSFCDSGAIGSICTRVTSLVAKQGTPHRGTENTCLLSRRWQRVCALPQTSLLTSSDVPRQDPMVQFEFKEIKAALEFDRTVAANVGWKSLIATPGNRKRMRIIIALAIFSQWSGNGLLSYYLSKVLNEIGITSSSTQLLINGVLQIWSFIFALYGSYTVNRLGRRLLFLGSAGLMTLFYMAQAICFAEYAKHGTAAAGHAVIAFIFLYSSSYALAFSPLVVSYTVEILPFHLRAKGLCFFNFIVSLALIFNQYVNPIALDALGWKYYVRGRSVHLAACASLIHRWR